MEDTQQQQALPKRAAAGIAERKIIDRIIRKEVYLIRMGMLICFGMIGVFTGGILGCMIEIVLGNFTVVTSAICIGNHTVSSSIWN